MAAPVGWGSGLRWGGAAANVRQPEEEEDPRRQDRHHLSEGSALSVLPCEASQAVPGDSKQGSSLVLMVGPAAAAVVPLCTGKGAVIL